MMTSVWEDISLWKDLSGSSAYCCWWTQDINRSPQKTNRPRKMTRVFWMTQCFSNVKWCFILLFIIDPNFICSLTSINERLLDFFFLTKKLGSWKIMKSPNEERWSPNGVPCYHNHPSQGFLLSPCFKCSMTLSQETRTVDHEPHLGLEEQWRKRLWLLFE